ncbi:unnamed protein product [Ceratitis capitata]|uniref:(Mediterranean fruit fly) hypothetical protein n=1 Tax=Ceratitis capitata TaxID=7213 RepID=A0A811UTY3_CERCA|nr:unnamed protein product [Ceratitis capitata]
MNQRFMYVASAYVDPVVDQFDTLVHINIFLRHTSLQVLRGVLNGWRTLWGSENTNQLRNVIASIIAGHNMAICNSERTPTFNAIRYDVNASSNVDIDAPLQRPPVTLQREGNFTETGEITSSALFNHFYPNRNNGTNIRPQAIRKQSKHYIDTHDEVEVLEALSSMNLNRAPGIDNLTSDIQWVTAYLIQQPI